MILDPNLILYIKKTLSTDPLTTPPKKMFSRNFIFLDNKVFISFIKNNLLATAGLPISPLVSSSSQKPFFWIKVALIPKFYLKNQRQESFFRKKHWLKKFLHYLPLDKKLLESQGLISLVLYII